MIHIGDAEQNELYTAQMKDHQAPLERPERITCSPGL